MCDVEDCSNTADSDRDIALLLLEAGKLCVLQKIKNKNPFLPQGGSVFFSKKCYA